MVEVELFHWRRVEPYVLDGEGVPLLRGRRATASVWAEGDRWYYTVYLSTEPRDFDMYSKGTRTTSRAARRGCEEDLVGLLTSFSQASGTKGLQTPGQ